MDLKSLGIIGNCQYSALINKDANVAWMCWPRFDSSCVFGSLLDTEQGGEFSIQPEGDYESSQAYVQNTNILKTTFRTSTGTFEVIDFAPRFKQFQRVYQPTMMVRMVRPLSGEPRIRVRCRPVYDYGKTKPTISVGSNHLGYHGFPARIRLTTDAPLTYVQDEIAFALTKNQHFVLTWGNPLEAPIQETCDRFYQYTKDYWQTWVKHCSVPQQYQDQVIRSALVLKLHQYRDTGAIIAATTTSLPESDGATRNWDYRYCWLRDAYFTLSALRHLGQFQELEAFVEYVRNIAEADNSSHLQPVYAINGNWKLEEQILEHLSGYRDNKPVRIGNDAYTHIQNDVYGEMVLAIAPLFLDRRFVNEDSPPPKKLLSKLLAQIDRTMEMPDAGIWEFRGRAAVHTFSVLMHWLGATEAVKIASRNNLPDLLAEAENLQKRARDILEKKCWNPDLKCYAEAAGSGHMDASLFSMINLGFLTPDHPRAEDHLAALEKQLKTDNNLIYRYLHPDDFGKPEVTFTVCSFWYVEALARLGHRDQAEELFESYLKHTNDLGLLSEDIHPGTLELWGNFPQTYSHVGLINAAFELYRT